MCSLSTVKGDAFCSIVVFTVERGRWMCPSHLRGGLDLQRRTAKLRLFAPSNRMIVNRCVRL